MHLLPDYGPFSSVFFESYFFSIITVWLEEGLINWIQFNWVFTVDSDHSKFWIVLWISWRCWCYWWISSRNLKTVWVWRVRKYKKNVIGLDLMVFEFIIMHY